MLRKKTFNDMGCCCVADKLCELQHRLDEYDRFMGDLIVTLSKKRRQTTLVHECHEYADWIEEEIDKLLSENQELKAKLHLTGIEFDAGNEK